ncbi:MAG: hypothetical protein NZ890_19195 [Myxococcota bacterium]|nr:hypothetical protein [Myxococcota bacterium]
MMVTPQGDATAYVRMRTPAGAPLRWTQGCALMSPSERTPPELPLADLVAALSAAAGNWSRATSACSAIAIHPRAPGPRRAAPDGVGALLVLTGRWGRGQVDYDPSAAAVTTLAFQNRPGQAEDGIITDADIELNGVGFFFAIVDPAAPTALPGPGPGQRLADLENTLTHELGHVLGLGHNCWDRQTATPPLQHDGHPAPPCDGPLTPALRTATMFPYAADGETSKRTPSEDDIRGICEAYPKDEPLPPCEQTVQGGCQAVRGRTMRPRAILLLAVLGLVATCGRVRMRGRLRISYS